MITETVNNSTVMIDNAVENDASIKQVPPLADTNEHGELEKEGVPPVIDMKDLTLIHNSTTKSE